MKIRSAKMETELQNAKNENGSASQAMSHGGHICTADLVSRVINNARYPAAVDTIKDVRFAVEARASRNKIDGDDETDYARFA